MRTRWFAVAAATAARASLADRAGLGAAAVFYVVVTTAVGALWRAAAESGGGQVVGYGGVELTWYVAVAEAATVALGVRMIEEIGDDIASGSVAAEMLRPASVVGVRVATRFGRALPRLGICAGAGAVLAAVTGGRPPSVTGLVLAVPALVLAIACNLLAQHACAAAAFWVRDARSTWFLYQKVVFVLGGMLLPLEVLPGGLQAVARALPFMAMAYAPARLAAGHVEPLLLVTQVGWLLVLAGAALGAFRAGERRLQAVGG